MNPGALPQARYCMRALGAKHRPGETPGCRTGWKLCYFPSRSLYDLGEAARIEAGAADQCAINVWLAH